MKTIGITFDEQPFIDSLSGGLEIFNEIGYNHFEFVVHESILPLGQYSKLIQKSYGLNCGISFHVPSFVKNGFFKPELFNESNRVKEAYMKQFLQVSDIIESDVKRNYIIHGAEFNDSNSQNQDKLKESLIRLIDFSTNFIEKNKLPLRIIIENSFGDSFSTFPGTIAEVDSVLETLDGYPLGVCLDIPHFIASKPYNYPKLEFNCSNIEEVHCHGFTLDPYKSHLPVSIPENSPNMDSIRRILDYISAEGYAGSVVLEILGLEKNEYIDYASKDINLLY